MHISNILDIENIKNLRNEEAKKTGINPKSSLVVNEIFHRFKHLFSSFDAKCRDIQFMAEAKKTWAEVLTAENITSIEQVQPALRKCIYSNSEFAPSVPVFISWCKPTSEDLGLPDVHSAYKEACANSHPCADKKWTHPAIYHAWKLTGSNLLRESTQKISYPVFERNYAIVVRKITNGEDLGGLETTLAINAPKILPEGDRATASNYVASMTKIREMLGMQPRKVENGDNQQSRVQDDIATCGQKI